MLGSKRERNIFKWVGPRRDLKFFLGIIYLFRSVNSSFMSLPYFVTYYFV